jgi:hypothetical protein
MKKLVNTDKTPYTELVFSVYTPTMEQIDALAWRLLPEIKKFFADEQIQEDFAQWKEGMRSIP